MKRNKKLFSSKIKNSFTKSNFETDSDAQIIKKDIIRIIRLVPKNYPVFKRKIKKLVYAIFLNTKIIPNKIFNFPNNLKNRLSNNLKKKKYRSFRLQKKINPEISYLPSAKIILWSSLKFIGKHYSLILKIIVFHFFLYLVFAKTPTTTLSVSEIKQTVNQALGEGSDRTLNGTVATLSTVVGLGAVGGNNNIKISLLIFLMSMIYIWAIRQTINGHKVKFRDVLYQSFAPLFSSIIILTILTLQLLPFALVSFVYSVARTGGIFVSGFEDMSFFIITCLVGILSFYFAISTIIAFYISTLPGMYPIQAIVSAKKLVQFQKMRVFKRVISLPILILISYLFVLVILIRFFQGVTLIFNEAFIFLIIPVIHVYYYKLYRALI